MPSSKWTRLYLNRGMSLLTWLLLPIAALTPLAAGAEVVGEVKPQGNGNYLVQIDGKRYIALGEAGYNQLIRELEEKEALKKQLAAATDKLERYQTLTMHYEELRGGYLTLTGEYKNLTNDALRLGASYAEAADKLVTLNQDYSKLVHDYDSLTEKYRTIAMRSRPRQAVDIGIGAISTDSKANGVLMVGAGSELLNVSLRGWLLGGPDHYGVMVGASF